MLSKKRKEYQKKWRDNNLDKVSENYKKWYYSRESEEHRKRRHKYLKNNKWYKIADKYRRKINHALKSGLSKKSAEELLGTDIETYKEYLEMLFEDGMNWGNRGKWHIDHIIPISHFDMFDYEQVKKAFYFTNTRPIWAIDNLRKTNSIPYLTKFIL